MEGKERQMRSNFLIFFLLSFFCLFVFCEMTIRHRWNCLFNNTGYRYSPDQ